MLEEKPVSEFFKCLLIDPEELGAYVEDPLAYLIEGDCALEHLGGEENNHLKRLILSMDEERIKDKIMDENPNPQKRSDLETLKLMKGIDP